MTEASPRPLTRGIIRAALDRVAPGRTLEDAAPVVACPAAERVRVLDANGAERACEYAPQADAPEAREALARELAAGVLPYDRCRWCSELAQHGALARAPAVRRYAPLWPWSDGATPRRLVLRFTSRSAPDAQQLAAIAALQEGDELVLLGATLPLDELAPVAHEAAARGVALTLAVARTTEHAGIEAALGAAPVATVELRLEDADAAAIAAARDLAARAHASLRVDFLLTPGRWYDFERADEACQAAELPLTFSIVDQDGHAPLDDVSAHEVQFVTDVVISSRSRGDDDAAGRSTEALDALCNDLRTLLHVKLSASADAQEPAPDTKLSLPPDAHPFNADEAKQGWWWQRLFSHTQYDEICDDLVAAASDASLEESAWLRQLLQRVAAEKRRPDALAQLQRVYGPQQTRPGRIADDERFTADFDVAGFGGPWATQLGLDAMPPRQAPFGVAPREPSGAAADADVTVLIPSYKHEPYIEETMRSVLGQTFEAFKLLVVDDRSPDETVARARAVADPRVEVRVSEQNLGLGNSVLAALETIDTPYVALLNSDDLLHPERLERCREALEQDPDAMLVTTDLTLIDRDGGVLTPDNVSLVLDGKQVHDWVHWYRDALAEAEGAHQSALELFTALLRKNFLATSSNLVARKSWLMQQAEALKSLKFCLDWQLFLEAALEGTLRHIAEPLAAYRLHATNTVWFHKDERWSYYLEVNRVATEALLRFHARGEDGPPLEQLRSTLTALTAGLAHNGETHGLAMLLNAIVDRVGLEGWAAEDETTRTLIQQLASLSSTALSTAHEGSDARQPLQSMHRRLLQTLLEQARRDVDDKQAQLMSTEIQLQAARDDRERSEEKTRRLYQDQRERIQNAQRLDEEKQRLYQDQQQRIERAREQERRLQELYDDQKARIDRSQEQDQRIRELYEDQKERIAGARKLEADKRALYEDQKQRIERAKQQEQRLIALYADQKDRIARIQALEAEHAGLRSDIDTAQSDLADARARNRDLEDEVAARTAQVRSLSDAKRELGEQLRQQRRETARLDSERLALLGSREYRLGNFFWNKLPFANMAISTKNWFQRLFGAKERATADTPGEDRAAGTAVVAACWQWPIYSHTFVYQEMISLGATGLDVQLFHWDLTDTDDLHAAFEHLNQNRTHIKPDWKQHKQDKAYIDQAYPGKLRAFLERVAPLVGKTVDELEEQPIVMQACTFTRRAEQAGARYLHSYFFYDQSFMAMIAAWVLDLPRGVSCYADHMMDDFEFKLVPLHVELADVIVATSARIKHELSQLSGGHWDDKIVVKPNGVDGERFPARVRPARAAGEPFEVISVSRIEPKKGLTHLVEAIAELKKRGHTVVAHIIGSKDANSAGSLEYAESFEQCIKDHGLEDQIVLHGMMKQEQMPPLIEKSRAFVAPYVETESGDKDGIPTAMLEALASSLPIITTDSGSITEVVDDGVEGFVVGQRDSLAFADALEKVITDGDLERRLSAAARARFDRDFDIKVTERRLHERVTGFLAQKSRS